MVDHQKNSNRQDPGLTLLAIDELTSLAGLLAEGDYERANALFKLTRKSKHFPASISELAESFGLMLVKTEAREFALHQKIEELRVARAELEAVKSRLANENTVLRKRVKASFRPENIIGSGDRMRNLLAQTQRLSQMPVNVLVTGETGTGKELIAKMLHYNGNRSHGPFIAINCTAIPEDLIESELFGIEKGVASGVDGRTGRIEQANGGTLFLDEIGDMPLGSQAKILRVLEERRLVRVGGKKEIPVDIRLVAATHRNLEQEVAEKRFRQDLLFRIKVVNLQLPPLRERREDIPLLASLFLKNSCHRFGLAELKFAPETMDKLAIHNWPGNIRQLENEVERLAVLCLADSIYPHELSPEICSAQRTGNQQRQNGGEYPINLQDLEKQAIAKALNMADSNRTRAAEILGISREGLRKKMQRHKLS